MKIWIKANLGILLIILLTALIYRESFISPFFQDDKYLLETKLPQDLDTSIPDFHYHPLANQLFFGLTKSLFGLNPVPFHLVLFLVFVITLFAIFYLSQALGQSQKKSLLTVFFWATNVSIFANFYWLAISYFVIGAFFILLTCLLFLRRRIWSLPLALLSFIFAFLSNELALVIPGLLTLIVWFQRLSWKNLVLFYVLGFVLFLFKIFWVKMPTDPAYHLEFTSQVFSTLKWYLLRALNLPEGADRAGVLITGLFVVFLGLLVLAFWSYLRSKPRNFRLLIFSFGFFIVGSLPFFFLPNHMSSYYLTVALFGPALIYAEVITKKLLLAAILIYILLTFFGLQFLSKTHWIILKNTGPIGQFSQL